MKQTQIERKHAFFRSKRKLVHDPYISTKMCMKKRRHLIFQKSKHFPNNILSVSREKLLSKCNEYDFLLSV